MPELLPKRMRYFNGQFLKQDDFQEEQSYQINRHRIHNRSLHTTGISEGLEVTISSDNLSLIIKAGVALDIMGREIVLATDTTIPQTDITSFGGMTRLLTITYVEQPSDPASVGTAEFTRFTETPKFEFLDSVRPSPDPDLQSKIPLGKVVFNAAKPVGITIASVDSMVRRFAGTQIRGDIELNKISFVSSAPTTAWPSLSSIITAAPSNQVFLKVSGSLNVSVALNVDGVATATQVNTNSLNVLTTGALSFSAPTRQMINMWGDKLYGIGIQPNTLYFRTGFNFAWFYQGQHVDTQFEPGAGGRPLMVLNNSGNLGIGTTTPAVRLDVSGDADVSGSLSWGSNNSVLRDNQGGSIELGGNDTVNGVGTPYIDFHYNGLKQDFNTRIINDADGRLTLQANMVAVSSNLTMAGSLGIGTTNPSHKFHVVVPDGAVGLFESTTSNAFLRLSVNDGIDNRVEMANRGGGRLALWTGGYDHFNITKTGLVGVGTTDPKNKLHVAGNAGVLNLEGQNHVYVQWYPQGYANGRKGWTGYNLNETALSIFNETGGVRIHGTDALVISNINGVVISNNLSVGAAGSLSFGNATRQMINLWSTDYGIGVQGYTQYFRTATHFAWYLGGTHHNDAFNPGANGKAMMVLNSSGNLGIGTTAPGARLHVAGGDTLLSGNVFVSGTLFVNGTDLILDGRSRQQGRPNRRALVDITEDIIIPFTNQKINRSVLHINYAGDYALAMVDSTLQTQDLYARDVWSNNNKLGSDLLWKKDINTIHNALEKVRQLRGVTFNWRVEEFKERGFGSNHQIGLIAQEVEKIVPEVVSMNDEGYRAVEYGKLSALLIEAAKQLANEVDTLKSRLAQLERSN